MIPRNIFSAKFDKFRKCKNGEIFAKSSHIYILGILLLFGGCQLRVCESDVCFGSGSQYGVWKNINSLLGEMPTSHETRINLELTEVLNIKIEDLNSAIALFEQNLYSLSLPSITFSPSFSEDINHLNLEAKTLRGIKLHLTSVKLLLQVVSLAKNQKHSILIGDYLDIDGNAQFSLKELYQQVMYVQQRLAQLKLHSSASKVTQ